MNCTRWNTDGVRSDGRNVPLQLKRVLAAMRSDLLQPAPHQDFLHCLDKNRVRREETNKMNVSYSWGCLRSPNNEDDVLQLMYSTMLMRCFCPSWTSYSSRWVTNFWSVSDSKYSSPLTCSSIIFIFTAPVHLFSLLRLLKSRICTRFLCRRSSSVYTVTPSRLRTAICSASLCI